jgi:hypothetical protein
MSTVRPLYPAAYHHADLINDPLSPPQYVRSQEELIPVPHFLNLHPFDPKDQSTVDLDVDIHFSG